MMKEKICPDGKIKDKANTLYIHNTINKVDAENYIALKGTICNTIIIIYTITIDRCLSKNTKRGNSRFVYNILCLSVLIKRLSW